jgi:hypothetical protein
MTTDNSQLAFELPDLDPELQQVPVPGNAEPGRASGAGLVPGSPEPAVEPATEPVPGSGLVPGSPEPAQGRFPELVPGSVDGTSGTMAGPVPVIAVPEDRISFPHHLWLSLLDRAREAAEHQKRHRTFWHWLWNCFWNTSPETLADHRKYLQSRQWLEDYMTGYVRWVIEWENVLYGVLVARTVKVVCQTIDRNVQRQSRFWILVGLVIAGLLIRFASHP